MQATHIGEAFRRVNNRALPPPFIFRPEGGKRDPILHGPPGKKRPWPTRRIVMRQAITDALKTAQKAQDKPRVSTLRMVNAAIQDRDIANRGTGKPAANDDDILQILTKMVKQREESAAAFIQGNRPELAGQERQEIEIIREFLPTQMGEEETKEAIRAVIAEIGAAGLRDMGRAMTALKEKYPGKMDFGKASGIVKSLLQ